MISIVICSRTKNINSSLYENIKATIGCVYELVVIDNSENKYSIFEAYNIGIKKSIGDYCCFIHDDILLLTQDWGVTLEQIFKNDPKVGLIGVAGSKVKTKIPSAWWDCEEEHIVMNIIQHFPKKTKEHWDKGFINNVLEEVAAVDGVFMVMRKDERIKFNEDLKGFHNYDLNLALECNRLNYKIVVTNQILVEHFSIGTINKDWVNSSFNFYEHYKNRLPLNIVSNLNLKKQEVLNAKKFINECLTHKEHKIALLIWLKLVMLNPISKFHFKFWKRITAIK